MSEQLYRKCSECEGSGKTGNDLCDLCVGTDSDMWGMVPLESFEAGFFINKRGIPEVLTSDERILEGGSYQMIRTGEPA